MKKEEKIQIIKWYVKNYGCEKAGKIKFLLLFFFNSGLGTGKKHVQLRKCAPKLI